jgi:hypothetical protein
MNGSLRLYGCGLDELPTMLISKTLRNVDPYQRSGAGRFSSPRGRGLVVDAFWLISTVTREEGHLCG